MTFESFLDYLLLAVELIIIGLCFMVWFMPTEQLNDVMNAKGDDHEAN